MFLIVAVCILLADALSVAASQQITHDQKFQADYVLEITEQEIPVACVTRLTTLVNGWSTFNFHRSQPLFYLTHHAQEPRQGQLFT